MKFTSKQLVKLVGLGKQTGFRFEFERRLPDRMSILSDIRPSVTPKGHFSVRTVYLKEDGVDVAYDGNYEFNLAATIVNGERHELPQIKRRVP
jgi:hypothetical protein